MKSLAERQADRIQRKADNAAFSEVSKNRGNLGLAAVKFAEFGEAISNLDEDQRTELKEILRNEGDPFTVDKDTYGDSYDGNGNLKSAGVGVANPLIAPVSAQTAMESEAGVDTGWGAFVAEPNVDPSQGNAAGVAIAAASAEGAGAGSEGSGAGDGFPAGDGAGEAPSPPAKAPKAPKAS